MCLVIPSDQYSIPFLEMLCPSAKYYIWDFACHTEMSHIGHGHVQISCDQQVVFWLLLFFFVFYPFYKFRCLWSSKILLLISWQLLQLWPDSVLHDQHQRRTPLFFLSWRFETEKKEKRLLSLLRLLKKDNEMQFSIFGYEL